jgi:hypothetical protein
MRAARYYGIEDIRVEEIPEPVCEANQLKIRPAFVGICGTGIVLPPILPVPSGTRSAKILTSYPDLQYV